MKIPNAVAIITGGASGLGEAVVLLLHSMDCQIAIWDQNVALGEALTSKLKTNVLFCQVDVTSEDSVKSALSATISKFGKVTILVNCAGILLGKMIITSKQTHSLEDFAKVIKVNTVGTFNVSRLVAKQMSEQSLVEEERGVIILIASIAGYEAQRGQTAYGSSKGGVLGLTLPMARDLAAYSIRVNTLAPGIFGETRMSQGMSKAITEGLVKEIPMRRAGRPHELAHAVKFLVENTFMNGSVVRIDGGGRLGNI